MVVPEIPRLVQPEWLEAHLDNPDLRVVDCTVHLSFDAETGARHSEPGLAQWEEAHIPGSVFLDVPTDLSARGPATTIYPMPSPARVEKTMSALGVGDGTGVVLYDSVGNSWACRVWWILRAHGFDRAGVLDGGFSAWCAEDRPLSSDEPESEQTQFRADPRPGLFVEQADVRAAIEDETCCLINGLPPEDFDGTGIRKYGRLGRIPGSVSAPVEGEGAIIDEETARYLPVETLRERFASLGAFEADRVITYCGGGIAASSVAFALTLAGVDNVAVYDGSLSEWAHDEDLPLVTDGDSE